MEKERYTVLIRLAMICLVLANVRLTQGAEMTDSQQNHIRTLLFVPNRALLVGDSISGARGNIRFWSMEDGKMKFIIDLGEGVWVKSLAISHNGDSIAVALYGNDEMGCYSLKEKRWLWRAKWKGKIRHNYNLRYTPDDHGVVIQGLDKIVTYDARTGNILRKIEDASGFSGGFQNYKTRFSALSPSARYAVMWQGNLEHDETLLWNRNIWVIVWDIEKEQVIGRQGEMQSKYKNCSAVFTPNEKRVLLGSMDGVVREWSISEQKTLKEWKAYGMGINAPTEKQYTAPFEIDGLIVSSDGQYLAAIGYERKSGLTVRIFDYASNTLIHEFINLNSRNTICSGYPMTFATGGKYFALERTGKLCLYETASWKEKWCVPSVLNQYNN